MSKFVVLPLRILALVCLLTFLLLSGTVVAWASGVTINAPGASSQVTGRTPFSATATSAGLPITAMKVYLDNQTPEIATYNGNNTSTLSVNATYAIATGPHTLTVNAWDTSDNLYQSVVSFTVSPTGVFINAPGESAQVVSPVPFSATASSNGAVLTVMKVYVDWNSTPISTFNGNGTASFTASSTYSMANGAHTFIVNAWDSGGQIYQSAVDFTIFSNGMVISAPAQNAQVASPVAFSAAATSNGAAITAIKTYLDFNTAPIQTYNGNGTSTLDVQDNYSIASGPHTIIANAWDTGGQIYQSAVNFTVGTSSQTIPPSNATETANIDDMTNWGACSSKACSGNGGGSTQSLTPTFGVTNPALDSNGSVKFNASGSGGADILHWNNLPANDSVTHFVLDYNFQVDNTAPIQALEFDFVQGTGSQKFNFSSQCDNSQPSNPVWDTWDEPSMTWTRTSISCANVLNTNNWHHVRLYGEMLNPGNSSAQTHYIWIEVDGVQTTFPDNVAFHNAPSSTWHKLVIQIQQDLNNNPGNGFNEYVDKLNLFVW